MNPHRPHLHAATGTGAGGGHVDEHAHAMHAPMADEPACGLCLDTSWLYGIGPCEACCPDRFVEYLLDYATAEAAPTGAEEPHDGHDREEAS